MRAWNWNLTNSKKIFSTWLFPDIIRYDSPMKCPTILYAVNLWLKPVSLGLSHMLFQTIFPTEMLGFSRPQAKLGLRPREAKHCCGQDVSDRCVHNPSVHMYQKTSRHSHCHSVRQIQLPTVVKIFFMRIRLMGLKIAAISISSSDSPSVVCTDQMRHFAC